MSLATQVTALASRVATEINALRGEVAALPSGGGLDGYNSVKDFGAVGDGVANDTTAVQNALYAGGVTYFPPGDYSCGMLTIPKGAHLKGTNGGSYTWNGSAYLDDYPIGSVSKIVRRAGANTVLIYGPEGSKHVILEDLEIDGNNQNQTANSANVIELPDVASPEDTQWKIDRCYIHGRTDPANATWGSGASNIYIGANRQACHITNSILNYANWHGAQIMGADTVVDKCLVGDNGSSGLVLGAWVIRVTNTDIWNSGNSGINIIENGNGSPKRITIAQCGIDRNNENGILIDKGTNSGAAGVSIMGCAFTSNSKAGSNTWAHIAVKSTTGEIVISGNIFSALEVGYANQTTAAVFVDAGATAVDGGNIYESGSVNGMTNDPLRFKGLDTRVNGTGTSQITVSPISPATGPDGELWINSA